MQGKDGDSMHNFFVESSARHGNSYIISGADFNHIKNVLRMHEGDTFLISECGTSNLCRLDAFEGESVIAEIIEEKFQNTELKTQIYLFQGLPKSDKMELIIQKAVELGASAIIPVEMNRCVVKLDDKKKKSKTARWQAIAESAAKQSKRTVIPKVYDAMPYKQAISKATELDIFIVPYECKNGMESTVQALNEITKCKSVGIIIGPEGGFEESEISLAQDAGGITVSLGKRILRTETAAITAVGMCMLSIEMNADGE